jgi:membrane-associated phospholipid phosphatase
VTGATRGEWWRRPRWRWIAFGYLAAVGVGLAFGVWMRSTGDWSAGLGWERSVMYRFHVPLPRALDVLFLVVPWLGTNITLIPAIVAASVWLIFRCQRPELAAHLVTVEVGSWSVNPLIKEIFDRPRPELWEKRGQFAWDAYPSGHAIASVAVLYTIAMLLYRERGWRWPHYAATILLVVSLTSRLYLGVHWPTDVIGGVLIGLVWLWATWHAFRTPSDTMKR